VHSRRDGISRYTTIDCELIQSAAFNEIASIVQKARPLGEPPLTALLDGATIEIGSFSRLVELVNQEGMKKLAVQRYKGLGEMNADQLWETTMNPEQRRLLQLNIEDAVKANEIFSTLMGDQVEPRREFIERNALSVVNLDY
jgi:DNA gyrase subunit B